MKPNVFLQHVENVALGLFKDMYVLRDWRRCRNLSELRLQNKFILL